MHWKWFIYYLSLSIESKTLCLNGPIPLRCRIAVDFQIGICFVEAISNSIAFIRTGVVQQMQSQTQINTVLRMQRAHTHTHIEHDPKMAMKNVENVVFVKTFVVHELSWWIGLRMHLTYHENVFECVQFIKCIKERQANIRKHWKHPYVDYTLSIY